MGLEFLYTQPVKIRFGEGSFDELGAVLEELGVQKAVLVCGKHFAAEAQALLDTDPHCVAVFSGVEQNPRLSGVEETVRLARETGADAVVGIGGGSAIDTAKFATTVAPNQGAALDHYRGERAFDAKSRLAIVAELKAMFEALR